MADGRSEAREAVRGSDRVAVLGVRGAGGGGKGGGGEGEGAGGRDECDGEHSDGRKERGRGEDGDKHPASSLSISLSNFTSPGGSTPYLREDRHNKKVSKVVTIN